MQLPALKASRLPWCAVQTNAQPLMHTNRKCGLGDGDESDLEWLEAEIPRQVNIWTAASAGLAQTNNHRLLLHLSPDWWSPPGRGRGRGATFSVTGRLARRQTWHSWYSPWAASPKVHFSVEGGECGAQSQEEVRCCPELSSAQA